mgnify:FL=1|jgi:hypothetical protein|tara:strand:+ start:677 stop:1879 length:1203 start_codon:yes stop_codon:yes gene_type:complete
MSYTKEQLSSLATSRGRDNKLQSLDSVFKAIRQVRDRVAAEFFEIEAFEVLEVNIDPEKPSFPKKDGKPDYDMLGSVKGRYLISEFEANIDRCKNFRPLNMNNNQYPLVGEICAGIELFGQRFYFSPTNLFGNTHQNTKHGISGGLNKNSLVSKKGYTTAQDSSGKKTGYYSNDLTPYKPLLPFEGDTIFNGRYGQGIRIGSDKKKNSNILLSVGHEFKENDDFKLESPDNDGASIYVVNHKLSEEEKLKFTPGKESKVVTELDSFSEPQIYMGANRIILNTKQKGDIYLSSNNNIAISSVNNVVIEDRKTQIGSTSANEPLVLGNKNADALTEIHKALNAINQVLSAGLVQTVPSNIPVVVGPAGQSPFQESTSAAGELGKLIPKTKSEAHFTEKGTKS